MVSPSLCYLQFYVFPNADFSPILSVYFSFSIFGLQLKRMIECSVCRSIFSPTSKAISRAYNKHRIAVSSKSRALNVLLVVGDCILVGFQVIIRLSLSQFIDLFSFCLFGFLFSCQPILVYMSKVDDQFKFSPISVNFLTEAAKVLFAIVMLLIQVLSNISH